MIHYALFCCPPSPSSAIVDFMGESGFVEPWHLLAAIGLLLTAAEIFTPTFFALPAGLAFMATAALGVFTDNSTILISALAVNLGIVYGTFYKFVWPRLQKNAPRSNADAMSGKIAVVTEAVDPRTGAGEVKLYGDLWRVISDQSFEVGERVNIVATRGNKVVIEPVGPSD